MSSNYLTKFVKEDIQLRKWRNHYSLCLQLNVRNGNIINRQVENRNSRSSKADLFYFPRSYILWNVDLSRIGTNIVSIDGCRVWYYIKSDHPANLSGKWETAIQCNAISHWLGPYQINPCTCAHNCIVICIRWLKLTTAVLTGVCCVQNTQSMDYISFPLLSVCSGFLHRIH